MTTRTGRTYGLNPACFAAGVSRSEITSWIFPGSRVVVRSCQTCVAYKDARCENDIRPATGCCDLHLTYAEMARDEAVAGLKRGIRVVVEERDA